MVMDWAACLCVLAYCGYIAVEQNVGEHLG